MDKDIEQILNQVWKKLIKELQEVTND